MAISAPSTHAPPDQPLAATGRPERDPATHRPLGRRRHLPGGRAVVGGLLVTLAAVGTFAAYSSASSGPTSWVVVTNRSVAVGEHLAASDLRAVPADLPTDVQATLFASVAELGDAVALAPLDADQAITRNDISLAPRPDGARTHDLSFALERDRALNGRIQPGELVDLVATFGSGTDATTDVVVRRVRVADLDLPAGSAAGSAAKVTITLAFTSEDDVLLAANALEVAKVTLSRSTGTTVVAPAEPASPGDASEVAPGSTASTSSTIATEGADP